MQLKSGKTLFEQALINAVDNNVANNASNFK